MTYANPASEAPADRTAPIVFTLTIFFSASLLFFVQPLFAKIVLPVIGGSPAVWTTAMLFFQSVLIFGYLYAHLVSRYVPTRLQVALHIALWAAALAFLPPALPEGWRLDATRPIAWQTLGLFAVGVGMPFALLSSNAPLIQSWYSKSRGPSAGDPYFLYGASNVGSLLALLAFPLAAEPLFGARSIAVGFSGGFLILGLGLLFCGLKAREDDRPVSDATTRANPPMPRSGTIVKWLMLAFVPSSLMLAVTSKISTDIGTIPVFWVIPLALYLLSFVVTFTSRRVVSARWMGHMTHASVALSLLLFLGIGGAYLGLTQLLVLIVCFFVIAVWCHRSLYDSRPEAANLTVFYVVMSVGGALGGLFNSIIAPLAFNDLDEGAMTLIVALLIFYQALLNLTPAMIFRRVVVLAAVGLTVQIYFDDRIFADRSFFGLHQVRNEGELRTYSNGTTLHGAQLMADFAKDRPTPITYYHRLGPLGQIMTSDVGRDARRIGIVGLGVGSLACYSQPGQDWHFYEIDSIVDRVARNANLFSFMTSCAPNAPTHLGDARVVLQDQTETTYDILVIDAYSSDAVPIHLTTFEAMQLYMDRLSEGGLLVFHISNRYYNIGLPLARSAEALDLGIWRQAMSAIEEDEPGFTATDVVVLSRDPSAAAGLVADARWQRLTSDGGPVWTDDRANPLSILK